MRKTLVLVHTRRAQSVGDWHEIAGYVREMADDIDVHVASNDAPTDPGLLETLACQPTLVFSPIALMQFRPSRGRIYQGRPMPKFEQVERLAAGKVPVPPTAILQPGIKLDPAVWGDIVLVKPSALHRSSHGEGIRLMRTEAVRYVPPEQYPDGHPGRDGPMLVQAFVYTGPRLANIRVLTLFGEPLYALEGRANIDTITPQMLRHMPNFVASQNIPSAVKEARLINDKRVLRLARKAYKAIPEAALQGVDILRQVPTGRLYVLEINAGGNVWHFSSSHIRQRADDLGSDFARQRREQFDAFRTTARLLVERTRQEAE